MAGRKGGGRIHTSTGCFCLQNFFSAFSVLFYPLSGRWLVYCISCHQFWNRCSHRFRQREGSVSEQRGKREHFGHVGALQPCVVHLVASLAQLLSDELWTGGCSLTRARSARCSNSAATTDDHFPPSGFTLLPSAFSWSKGKNVNPWRLLGGLNNMLMHEQVTSRRAGHGVRGQGVDEQVTC